MKIIYFLSFLFFTNVAFAQNKSSLRVQATYYIDSNSTLNLQQVEKQKFTAFKNNSINIGYNMITLPFGAALKSPIPTLNNYKKRGFVLIITT